MKLMRMAVVVSLLVIGVILAGCTKDNIESNDITEQYTNLDNEINLIEEEVGSEKFMEDEVIIMERSKIDEVGFIQAVGKNLYTGHGNLINLRGINAGGYLLQEFWMTPTKDSKNIKAELDLYDYLSETYGEAEMQNLVGIYQENYWTEADFNRCADLGINTIRLPFWYRNIVDKDGIVKEDWYEIFDWFIEEAGQRGIYVILDFHGAPGSQSGSDHSGIDGGDKKEDASEFFFGDASMVEYNQDLFYEIWETIAYRYKGNPVVAAYDLLNEPYCTYRYTSSRSASELHHILWDIYDITYKRIRAIDPDHLIIMEATWDPIDLPNPVDYNWTNIMYEYHNYLYDDYDNKSGGQIKNMQKKLNLIKSANYNVPTLMGEFSYFNNFDAWDEGLALLNNEGVNWTIWTYKVTSNYGNWGLYHHSIGNINLEVSTPERIAVFWAKVNQIRPNQRLIDVVVKYFNEEMIEYN